MTATISLSKIEVLEQAGKRIRVSFTVEGLSESEDDRTVLSKEVYGSTLDNGIGHLIGAATTALKADFEEMIRRLQQINDLNNQ